jgi:hypothetical protein
VSSWGLRIFPASGFSLAGLRNEQEGNAPHITAFHCFLELSEKTDFFCESRPVIGRRFEKNCGMKLLLASLRIDAREIDFLQVCDNVAGAVVSNQVARRCGEETAMNDRVEKFDVRELTNLRNELMQSGIDSFQAAQVLATFLAGRGYGISAEAARDVALRIENSGCSFDCMQKELERVALVM